MPTKKTTDDIARKAIKLGVREDHANAAVSKGVSDEAVEAYKAFVEALEENQDVHFSRK